MKTDLKNREFDLIDNIRNYKKKLFLNQLIKNTILFISICLIIYLIVNGLEFSLRLDEPGRKGLFFATLFVFFLGLVVFVLRPFIRYLRSDELISDEAAASQIGKSFPELSDKLLNTIQLIKKDSSSSLVNASLQQRSTQFSIFSFSSSINLKKNVRYLKYVIIPFLIILVCLLFIPQFITESTTRLINYDQFYSRAPFAIELKNKEHVAFKNEPYELDFAVTGTAFPEFFYLETGARKIKLTLTDSELKYSIPKVQDDFNFYLTAGSFKSKTYQITAKSRPEVKSLVVDLEYPAYTKLGSDKITNNGNLIVPEGTYATWNIETVESEKVQLIFDKDSIDLDSHSFNQFEKRLRLTQDIDYDISLENSFGQNKDKIGYHVEILEDKFPSIKIQVLQDSTLFKYLLIDGNIEDDYGFSQLQLVYWYNEDVKTQRIPFNSKTNAQKFFYQVSTDSINLDFGKEFSYYLSVFDNDQVNGAKESRSSTMTFRMPTKSEINEEIEKTGSEAKEEIDDALVQAQEIKDQIEEIQEGLKKQNSSSWQEKKKLKSLLNDRKQLEKNLKELSEKHKELTEKQNQFNKPKPELQKKAAQLQKLMEEVLDDETKKLYDELQKLLEKETGQMDIADLMEDLSHKEKNLEKEIERAIEMFKRMEFEYKMEEIITDLDNLEEEQSQLSEETKDKGNDLEDMNEKQSKLNEEFEKIEEEISKMEEMNDQLSEPESMEDLDSEQESIENEQQKASEELQKNNRKKAAQNQKNASDQMQQLSKKMKNMQAGMEMEMLSENIDNLKHILDNLIKLSFDQEELIHSFKGVNLSDPRYVTLSQNQLKLKDDAVIIEDSLLALADRVFQIQSFVTRELNGMNQNINESLQSLKDRKKSQALSNQQYTMTAINNLSLLLNDVLKQMQDQMAESMGMPQKGKKGGKPNTPSMSQLQKQLNEKIQQLKKDGASGRQLSKELAEIAGQQEMLRQELQGLQEQLNQGEEGLSDNLQEMIEKMEQTETELVNKNINQEMIRRQEEILTRMLQSEDAMRERELDESREAQTATNLNKNSDQILEEYLRSKKSELELLKTLPPKMKHYYKEEVNKYFQRLNEQ